MNRPSSIHGSEYSLAKPFSKRCHDGDYTGQDNRIGRDHSDFDGIIVSAIGRKTLAEKRQPVLPVAHVLDMRQARDIRIGNVDRLGKQFDGKHGSPRTRVCVAQQGLSFRSRLIRASHNVRVHSLSTSTSLNFHEDSNSLPMPPRPAKAGAFNPSRLGVPAANSRATA